MAIQKGLAAMKQAQQHAQRSRIPYVNLKKTGDKTMLRFLQEPDDIVQVYEHQIDNPRGKGFLKFTCPGEDKGCPFCGQGMSPSYRMYVNVIERGAGDKGQDVVKVLSRGITDAGAIVGLKEKYKQLIGRDFEATRVGSGAQTHYQFLPEDPKPLTAQEKKMQMFDLDKLVAERPIRELYAALGLQYDEPATGEVGSDDPDEDDSIPYGEE